MKSKTIVISILTVVFLASLSGVVIADVNQETDNQMQESNVTAGESLSIGVNAVSNDVKTQIDKSTFNNKMENADSDEDRLEIIEDEIDNLDQEASNINRNYENITNSSDEKRKGVSEIAHLSSDARNVQDRLENIEDTLAYTELSDEDEDRINNKLLDVRANTSITAGENAMVIRDSAMTNGLSVAVDARQNGLTVAADASNERVYSGTENRLEFGNETVTEEDAIEVAENEVAENMEYKSINNDRNGDYEVRFMSEDSERVVTVGSSTGEIRKDVEKRGIPEHAKGNVPEFVLSGENGTIGQGPPTHAGERGPPEWVKEKGESDRRGPPSERGPPFDMNSEGQNETDEDEEENENAENGQRSEESNNQGQPTN